jgi:predicted nucleotidyltransferase
LGGGQSAKFRFGYNAYGRLPILRIKYIIPKGDNYYQQIGELKTMNQNAYLNYWKKQNQEQTQKRIKEKQKAWKNLRNITKVLIEEFKATKIIVFGSLLTDKFNQESDIDLAVAGIEKKDYFQAFATVNDLGERPIDLKPLEDLDPYFLQKVLQKGECIYERN